MPRDIEDLLPLSREADDVLDPAEGEVADDDEEGGDDVDDDFAE
jgi:hypothetical protein